MVKKHLKSLMLIVLLIFILSNNLNVKANSDQYFHLNDQANLLTIQEKNDVENILTEVSTRHNLPVFLTITDIPTDEEVLDLSAEVLYQNVGLDNDGIILYIDMWNSEVAIDSSGRAIDIMDDDRKEDLLDEIAPQIRNNPYNMALDYSKIVDTYIGQGPKVGNTRVFEKSLDLFEVGIAGAAGLVVSGLSYASIRSKSKTSPEALVYTLLSTAALGLVNNTDQLIDTKRTRRVIQTSSGVYGGSSSGGSRSTVRTSSRGGSYSGSSRKF